MHMSLLDQYLPLLFLTITITFFKSWASPFFLSLPFIFPATHKHVIIEMPWHCLRMLSSVNSHDYLLQDMLSIFTVPFLFPSDYL